MLFKGLVHPSSIIFSVNLKWYNTEVALYCCCAFVELRCCLFADVFALVLPGRRFIHSRSNSVVYLELANGTFWGNIVAA